MGETGAVPSFLTGYGPPHRARERRLIATGRPGLRLRFYPGIRRELHHFLLGFARWLRGEISFHHPVRVTVVPHATVMGHDGAPGWAVFLIPGPDYARGDVIRIYVAGGKLRILERRYGLRRRAALIRMAHDLAHEVVHYEQWRDQRKISERGVNRRAESLVRTYLSSIAPEVGGNRRRKVRGRRVAGFAQARSASTSSAVTGSPAVSSS